MGKLNRAKVIAAAIEMLDDIGVDALTIPALAARLKIRPPSLYNHIESISDLKRELAIHGNRLLCEVTRKAAAGKARDSAVLAMANALYDFATRQPALYRLSVVAPPKSDRDWTRAYIEYRDLWFELFEGYGFVGADRQYAARLFRALIHGYVDIELSGGWTVDLDLRKSFQKVLRATVAGLDFYKEKRIFTSLLKDSLKN